MRKKLLSAMFAMTIVGMIGCSGGNKASVTTAVKDTVADKGLEVIGDNVKYNPNQLVNDGEPISLEFWMWGQENLFQDVIDKYTKIHPNVEIKLVNNPWDDYWTKLPLQLKGKSGPALFNVHNSYHDNLIQYMAPYDIPTEELEADFIGANAHVIDGKIYYVDYGIMTGSIYYNKQMWKDAGLTDADIPKTWDEFAKVAQKLTIKDGNTFKQAGFNFNGDFPGIALGLNYQLGQNLFNDDMKTATIDNEAMKKSVQMLVDLYDKYEVGSKDFGTKSEESFGQGQSAMICKWGHNYQYLKTNFPDLDFGIFEIPTFTEDVPYAYNRYNGESTFGINKNADEKEQEVAQDFIRYFLADDESQKEFCMDLSTFPAKKSLANDEDIAKHPTMSILSDTIDRYVWPGPMPATLEQTMKKVGEDVLYNGVTIDDALKQAETNINKDLKNTQFQSVEDLYKYAK